MKKIIFAGATAVLFSAAMGVASAYEYNHTPKAVAATEACACTECSCGDDCNCIDCANGNCDEGCCENSACCEKK
jgi:hypothetical protein